MSSQCLKSVFLLLTNSAHFQRTLSSRATASASASRGKKYLNYFRVLELLPEETTHDNVRRQYIRLVKKYHPDTNGDDPIAREKFAAVDEVMKLSF